MSQAALYGLYAILAAGAGGLYLCLPGTRPDGRRLRVAGAIAGSAAMIGVAMYLAGWIGPNFEGKVLFVIFALMAVIAAARVITHRRPVYSAMYFMLVVLASTVLCILASAEFLGAALLIIYGGAILVTYVFVIMLAQQAGQAPYDRNAREPLAAVLMGFLLVAATSQALVVRDPIARGHGRNLYRYAIARPWDHVDRTAADGAMPSGDRTDGRLGVPPGNTRGVGEMLMTTYVMAIEVAGVLLLVAVVGAIAIARKRIEPDALTPEERGQIEKHENVHQRGRRVTPF